MKFQLKLEVGEKCRSSTAFYELEEETGYTGELELLMIIRRLAFAMSASNFYSANHLTKLKTRPQDEDEP